MSTLTEIEQMVAAKSATLEGVDLADSVIWEEEPVGFREFCESPSYLGVFPLSDLQYWDVERLIGNEPKRTFSPNRPHDILILVYGKGGGKNEIAARLGAYLIYLLQCLANPQEFLLGVQSNTTLNLLNVAKKGRQAEKIFFTYFSTLIMNSRWFKDHFDIDYKRQWHSRVKRRTRRKGKIIMMTNGAIFPKHIEAVSETTENESWEGYNPFFFVLDEISGFTSAVELEKAWKIYNTARSSVETRVMRNFRGLGMVISYPRQDEGDVILELFKESQGKNRLVGSLAYPWYSKGMHNYSGQMFVVRHPRIDNYFGVDNVGIEVPIEYAGSFEPKNIEDSITKILCIPQPTAGGWLEYPELLKSLLSSCDDPKHPRHRLRLFETVDQQIYTMDDDGQQVRYLVKNLINCRARSQFDRFQVPRVAWLDAAKTNCDAVIVIGHLEQRIVRSSSGEVPVETVVIDDELIWRPDPAHGIRVSLKNVEHWMTTILPEHINLIAAGADQWNSAELEEELRYKRITAVIHNVSASDYDLFKRQVYVQAMDLLPGEAYGQFTNLVHAGEKKKPVHKPDFLQDVADAIVGVTWLLVGQDKRKRPSIARRVQRGMPVGVRVGGTAPISHTPAPGSDVYHPVGHSPQSPGIRNIAAPMAPRALQMRPTSVPVRLPHSIRV